MNQPIERVEDAVGIDLHAMACEVDLSLRNLANAPGRPEGLSEMLRYHLGVDAEVGLREERSRGKRLRSVLLLAIGQALSTPYEVTRPLLLAAEMMHAASLVHDDIQDNDVIRWGRPTAWKALPAASIWAAVWIVCLAAWAGCNYGAEYSAPARSTADQ